LSQATRTFLLANSSQIDVLAHRFSNYGDGITKTDVEHFVSQFESYNNLNLGLKLLNNVDFYDGPRVLSLARELGNNIKSITDENLQDVLICPLKPNPGSSAHLTQRKIKQTISQTIQERQLFNQKFISYDRLHTLSEETLLKKIFFVDDFIGSGDTVISNWGRFQALENDNHMYYVGALVAYTDSIQRIEEETASHFEIVVSRELSDSQRAFHPENHTFNQSEQRILKQICETIPNPDEHQYGHRNGQSLVIFSDQSPNNALPLLHKPARGWKPLFPRNL